MKVHAAAALSLLDSGVETIFGLMGDANMLMVADLIQDPRGRFVSAVLEGGAVSMADGYSRLSGRLGVASVTHGPAVTNSLTALTEAVRAGSAVLLMSGTTPSKRDFSQRMDLSAVASAAGADYWRILSPEHVVDDVAMMVARVVASGVPAILDIPYEFQEVSVDYVKSQYRSVNPSQVGPTEEALDKALGIIASAKRPIVLAGRGAALSNAREELIRLADAIGAPLGTTLLGKDLFRGHPFNLDIIGTAATDLSLEMFAKADCVITFGAGLNRHTTVDGSLFKDKAVIQCDVNPLRFGRHLPIDAAVLGDARAVAQAMLDQLVAGEIAPSSFREQELKSKPESYAPIDGFSDGSTDVTLDMRTAMIRLDQLLPADRVVVTDVGRFIGAAWRYLHVPDPTRFTHAANFTALGLGTATAIGAAVARPELLTVGVAGDGGAMMGLIEFSTAVRENIPFVLVVLNDGCYGAEYSKLEALGVNPSYALMRWPEFADVAKALGGDGVTVRNLDELDAAAKLAKGLARPLLIDVKADPKVNVRADW